MQKLFLLRLSANDPGLQICRHQERPRAQWKDNIVEWTGLKGDLLLR